MNFTPRFFISWLVGAIVMFLAFYLWHGVFLNDFHRINFSLALFLPLSALAYLIISFGLYGLYEVKPLSRIEAPFLRGLIAGTVLGLVLFILATVMGISFTKMASIKHLLLDCAWQVIEQCIGGVVIALGKVFVYDPIEEQF